MHCLGKYSYCISKLTIIMIIFHEHSVLTREMGTVLNTNYIGLSVPLDTVFVYQPRLWSSHLWMKQKCVTDDDEDFYNTVSV